MSEYVFKIVDDCGKSTYISAENRSTAIEKYCTVTGCPKEYVKEHCVIRKQLWREREI